MLGEREVVFIVKNWDDFKEHVAYAKKPIYRVIRRKDGKVEIRAKAGMLAWKGEFDAEDEREKIDQIIKTLESYGAIEVVDTMPDEEFI